MRIFHLADLHLGIRPNKIWLLEDQRYMLDYVVEQVRQQAPDVIILAGDIYDSPMPPIRAVELLDDFLSQLVELGVPTLVIAGNHDSAARLSFGAGILKKQNLHIGVFNGAPEIVEIRDEAGPVRFVLLPFLRASTLRYSGIEGAEEISTTDEAVGFVLDNIEYEKGVRYVLVAHQFVTRDGTIEVKTETAQYHFAGGLELVGTSHFAPFSYVALGHLHSMHQVGANHIRYSGSPLKYSFHSVGRPNGFLVVDLDEEGAAEIKFHEIVPLRRMRKLTGSFAELEKEGKELKRREDPSREDYLQIVLTDKAALVEPMGTLKQYFPNIMQLRIESAHRGDDTSAEMHADWEETGPVDLFAEFYKLQTGRELLPEESSIIEDVTTAIAQGGH